MYLADNPKCDGKSAEQVCNIIIDKKGTSFRKRTVQKYVKEVIFDKSPMKKGPDSGVKKVSYQLLVGAFESYVWIQQANVNYSTMNIRLRLSKVVNGSVYSILEEERTSDNLLNRILRDGAIDISASVDIPVKERIIRWNTSEILKLWFDTCASEL